MTQHTVQDLAWAKGTSEPARQMMFSLQEENESLRQQLAAALAACKLKDKALWYERSLYKEAGSDMDELGLNALTIQPDDSALKAWLGEPRSYLYKFNSGFGDGIFWSHRPTHNGEDALESLPLYCTTEPKS